MENKNRNKVVTHSLLATNNHRTTAIKDLGSVFIPLEKRVLSKKLRVILLRFLKTKYLTVKPMFNFHNFLIIFVKTK